MSSLPRRTQGVNVSDSRYQKSLYQSKATGFLEASLLGGNSAYDVYDLIDAGFEALQGYVTFCVGLEMYALYFDAGAWSDILAIKEYSDVFLDVAFSVRAGEKEL